MGKNIEKYENLHKKYINDKSKAEEFLKNPLISNLDTRIGNLKKKTQTANEDADNSLLKTDNLYDKTSDFIIDTKNINNDLTKLINDIISFGRANISLEDALGKAEETQKEIRRISNTITSLQDRRVYDMCTRIKEKIDKVYSYSPEVPFQNLERIENTLENLEDINSRIEADIDRAGLLNKNNSERIITLKEKIAYLNEKNDLATNEVENVLEKIKATNDVMDQLEVVYRDLLEISKSEDLNELENRIKRQMVKTPEMDEIFLKSLEHVQDLENKVKNYSK